MSTGSHRRVWSLPRSYSTSPPRCRPTPTSCSGPSTWTLGWPSEGPLPDGCWLLYKTGWGSRSRDAAAFANADENGPHTPGVSTAGAEWLAASPITGFGVETVGIDAGQGGALDPPFPAHYHLLGADKYGLTQLQGLERLPETGALLVVSPLPIVGGTGSPARVYALVDV